MGFETASSIIKLFCDSYGSVVSDVRVRWYRVEKVPDFNTNYLLCQIASCVITCSCTSNIIISRIRVKYTYTVLHINENKETFSNQTKMDMPSELERQSMTMRNKIPVDIQITAHLFQLNTYEYTKLCHKWIRPSLEENATEIDVLSMYLWITLFFPLRLSCGSVRYIWGGGIKLDHIIDVKACDARWV